MAKIIASVKDVQSDAGGVRLIYSVVVTGDSAIAYGADHLLDTSLSLKQNVDAMKMKIATVVASRGERVSTGDVIVFGGPVVTDDASFNDSSNGITSDKNAVELTPIAKEEPIRVASNPVVNALKWLVS